MMPTPEDLRGEVRRLEAEYLVAFPESADLPDDVVRRAVAESVLERYRPAVPAAFLDAFGDE